MTDLPELAAWLQAHPGQWRLVSTEPTNDLALDIIAGRVSEFGEGFDAVWHGPEGAVDIHARYRDVGGGQEDLD